MSAGFPAPSAASFARIAACLQQEAPGAIAFTAAAHGEGVTTVTAGVARLLASAFGKRILAIGFDPGARGLLGALPEAAEPGPNAALARAILAPDASGAARLDGYAAEARYDHILLDLPPYPGEMAALLGARAAGRAVLVIRAGRETEASLRQTAEALTQDGVRLLGAVMNATPRGLPGWLERLLR